jgi:hypothetical protein
MRITPAVVVTLLAITGSARAETAAPWDSGCESADAYVPETLPANVTGIPIFGRVDVVSASLLAADGTVVPTDLVRDELSSAAHSVLVPRAPLTVGVKYTVRWSDECVAYRLKSFVATAAIPLPSEAGLAVAGEYSGYFGGKCDSLGRPVMTRNRAILFAHSPGVTPWLSISDVDLLVDGAKVEWTAYENWGRHKDGAVAGYLSRSCPGPTQTRHVQVRVRLPNGPTFVTPTLSVELACLDAPPGACSAEPPPAADAGPAPVGSEGDPGSSPNQGSGEDTVRYGCHYSSGQVGGALWVMGIAAAVSAVRRRRARS